MCTLGAARAFDVREPLMTVHHAPATLRADAVIFDMDGTIVDSTEVVERMWSAVAERHGLDLDGILEYSHGRQSRDTFTRFLPAGADIDAAVAAHELAELAVTDGTVEIPGARALMDSLVGARHAVVTSAPRELARVRIEAAGLRVPEVMVAAEEMPVGKPDPAGYLLAAELLGVDPARCVVFEDADAGLRAAVASGATTVVVGGLQADVTAGLARVPDLRGVTASVDAETGEILLQL
ncbi:HAD-IA family hydrolase [Demequina capsici]|uniref:HAD-IA family hydrolase n=1 Tax=Demequina capsici TaxID=3075620 RepID=A0AA96F5F4_9MICO|nr:HAD-IA family hydrolase [Demequina sp. OYTSA14]WNM24396.1 HAD-IA family hydrolase [Demequina sp. OYTSA14]